MKPGQAGTELVVKMKLATIDLRLALAFCCLLGQACAFSPFEVTSTSSTSLKLTWSNIFLNDSKLTALYLITFGSVSNCSLSAEALESRNVSFPTQESTLEYNLTNLEKWTSYSVQISALLENGTNFKQTAPFCSTTKEDAPTGAPRDVSLQPLSSSTLSVMWNAPDANVTHGIVRNYTIKYRQINCDENSLSPVGNSSWNTTATETNETRWNLTNLNYWSCYEVRVAAVTVAIGLFSERRTTRTLENAPTGAPRDVTLQPISSSTLSVMWNAPDANVTHGIVRNYTIKYRQINCDENSLSPVGNSSWNTTATETNETRLNLTNLNYWSCYEVRVAAVTVDIGLFSERRTMRTLENAPTGAPRDVTLQPLSSSTLSVMWNAPDADVTHGIVRNYTIKYRQINCDENSLSPVGNSSWNTTATETNETRWNLTNLNYWSCYEVRVAAVTVDIGLFSERRTMRTLENAPTGAPRDVTLQPLSSSTLSVMWNAPDAFVTHGIVRNYTIKYRQINCDENSLSPVGNSSWNTTATETNETRWNLTNLNYWSCYEVRVAAVTVDIGLFSERRTTRTLENAPTGAPRDVTLQPLSSSTLSVMWNAPDAFVTHGIVRNYTIKYRQINCDENSLSPVGNSSWNTTATETNETRWNLTNLNYWSCYEVRVAAVTVDIGLFSERRTMRTLENAPTGAPRDVTLQPLSSSTLSVMWNAPDADVTHGIVRNYTIKYRQINCDENSLSPVGNSSWNTTATETNETKWNLTNLNYWSCYEVRVAAVTVDIGLFSERRTMRTLENAPTGAPRDVTLQPLSSSTLSVMWNAPDANVTHGIVRNYTIKYRQINCDENSLSPVGNSSWNTTATETNETRLNLTNLNYWSCYEVRVAAVTVDIGLFSERRTMRTLENAPTGAPRDVTLQPLSSSTLSVMWNAPDANVTHGIVRNYTIKYRQINCDENSLSPVGNSSWNTTATETNETKWNLTNLNYWSCYEVRVAAVTVDIGLFSERRTMRTLENAPTGAPRDVTLQPLSSSTLSVMWNAPDADVTHGIVRNYTIKYRQINCDENSLSPVGNSSWNTTATETNETRWNLTNLNYWSCYEVRVAAVTVAIGLFSERRTTRTLENAPTGAPRDVTLQPLSSSTLSVMWNAPDANVTHGIVRNYTIKYRQINCDENSLSPVGNSSWNTTATETNETKWNLTNLNYWSCYEVRVAAVTVDIGLFSERRTMRTLENAPTGAPRDVTLQPLSSSSLSVMWNAPDAIVTHGIVRNYTIQYRRVNCRENNLVPAGNPSWNTTETGTNGTEWTLTNLNFWSCYEVKVAAVTVAVGMFSETRMMRTLENAPTGSPIIVSLQPRSSSSLLVMWKAPLANVTHGIVRNYTIQYRRVNCRENNLVPAGNPLWNTTETGTNGTEWTLTNLNYWSCYEVKVAAVTISVGMFSETRTMRTLENAPTGSPIIVSLQPRSSSSLLVMWKAPLANATHGIVRNYTIQYRRVNCRENNLVPAGNPSWNTTETGTNGTEWTLTNLNFWSCYEVKVAAVTVAVGMFSETRMMRTLENAPTGSPIIVSLQPRSSSSLLVMWKAPLANVTHGIVRNYTIQYRRVNCRENNLVPAGNPLWNTTETGTNGTEWTLTNLNYWSCYEVKVAAVTISVGMFSETRTMRTLENAPTGSPIIVSLQPRSSSSLLVMWKAPLANATHGIVRNYTIQYRRVNCRENNLVPAGNPSWNTTETGTNGTEWTLTNLNFWSCYEVKVAAVTVAVGMFSETRMMRTLENAPTGSPIIVSLQPRSSSSLLVMWKAPLANVTHGIVRNYTIQYRRVNCRENNLVPAGNPLWNTTETGTNGTEWTLTNLNYWSCYEVKVAAVTISVGMFSETRTMRTLENAPTGSPIIVSLQPRSSSSLLVMWKAPLANATHGIVRNYTIQYRRVNCRENNLVPAGNPSWNTTETGTNGTEWTLTNLNFWSCYEVKVAAVTVAVGMFSETRTMRTLENAPTGSPIIVSLQPRSSSSLLVMWKAPLANATHGIVRNYTIQYRRVNCRENNLVSAGNPSWNTTETGTNGTEWTLINLNYWSCYEVKVAAVTVAVGMFSDTRTMRTLENAPTGSPIIVSLQPRSSSSLLVMWKAPLANATHGIVRNYTIQYRRVNCRENNLVPAGNPSWNTTETGTNGTEWTLTNLNYWSCYEVKVAAVTVAVGMFSETRTMRTLENAPTSPVTITKFTSASSTSLRLEWTPPPPDSRHGIIRKYDLFLAKGNCIPRPTQHPATTPSTASLSTKGEGTKTEAAPTAPKRSKRSSLESGNCVFTNYSSIKTVYDFTALEKYANYSVYIQCRTVDPSEISEIKVARTDEDTPGIPQSFTCGNTSKGRIDLGWEKPAEPNGIITSYDLTWNASKGSESLNTDAHVFSRSIYGLNAYTVYNFTLRAKTLVGPGVPISCIATTTDDAPGKPEELRSIVLSAWSIQLEWKEPSVKNGIIWWYDVQVRKNGVQIKDDKTERTIITINGLEPFTEYAFHVKTRGSADYSDAAVVSNKTSPSSPPPITGTVPVVTGSSSDRKTTYPVFLREFSKQNGVIKYYLIFVFIGKAPKKATSKFTAKNYNVHVQGKDAYVAAYLQKLPQDGIFIIGDSTTTEKKDASKRKRRSTTSFANSPLEPSREYSWFQRGCVSGQLCRDTGWQEFTTDKSPGPAPEKSIVGAVVGAVFGVLFLFIIVAAVFFGRRRYPEKFNIVSCGKKEGDDISLDGGVVNDGFQSDGGNAPIKVELFSQYVETLRQNQGYRFSEQFTTIQNIPRGTTECSDHAINRNKNRYTNIKAYDHTRVKLHTLNTPGSDYINANYIDGYKTSKAYIACQGTLTHTEDDFWRMIWEQDVQTIVMVTRCVEGGREKCSQYWPLSGSKRFDSMQVFTVERTEFPGYDISTLNVLNSREPGNEKFVRHFHFLQWPDHGVPESAPLLSFIRRVNESTPADAGPTVVHCSAGVGRTGTFIVLDTCLKKIANEGTLDPFNFLRHIRTQRNFMVQTEGQFVFINETLLEFIKCGKTEVVPNELRERIKWLKKTLPDGGIFLDKEFQLLQEFSQSPQDFTTAIAAYNKTKNRFLTILPFEKTRVVLRSIPGFPGSDYINANHIDGYSKEKAFIATQAPIPNTVDDFWRMVWEQQSTTIACLIKDSETARTRMHTYWPCEAKEAQKSGPLLIEMVAEHQQGDFIVREFKVTNSQRGTSRIIRHFQYTSWPDNGTPQNGAGIVDFIGQVQKWQQQTGDKVIIVHCSTGVGRSAVFIALCNLIERLKTENVIDVFRVVCKLKKERPGMVQTKGQYLFCHIALQDYLASFDIYSNFM